MADSGLTPPEAVPAELLDSLAQITPVVVEAALLDALDLNPDLYLLLTASYEDAPKVKKPKPRRRLR